MTEMTFSTSIHFAGKETVISCDARCEKAWGMSNRPTSANSIDEDDYEWLADGELGTAPEQTDVTEGGHNKPIDISKAHNKWCARECERSVIATMGELAILPDFSKRTQNLL